MDINDVLVAIAVIVFIGFLIYVVYSEIQTKDFERRLEESSKDGTILGFDSPEELMKDKRYDRKK